MSSLLDPSEYGGDVFELEEQVSFMHEGSRLRGVVVRVYNTRTLYHVEVDGSRYQVDPQADEIRRERTAP